MKDKRLTAVMEKITAKLEADGIDQTNKIAVKECLDNCVGSGLYKIWEKYNDKHAQKYKSKRLDG